MKFFFPHFKYFSRHKVDCCISTISNKLSSFRYKSTKGTFNERSQLEDLPNECSLRFLKPLKWIFDGDLHIFKKTEYWILHFFQKARRKACWISVLLNLQKLISWFFCKRRRPTLFLPLNLDENFTKVVPQTEIEYLLLLRVVEIRQSENI